MFSQNIKRKETDQYNFVESNKNHKTGKLKKTDE